MQKSKKSKNLEMILGLKSHIANMYDMYYNVNMDVTIRNINEQKYKMLKARAALSGKNIGELISEAISLLLSMPDIQPKNNSFQDLISFDFGKQNKQLSSEVDKIIYGAK